MSIFGPLLSPILTICSKCAGLSMNQTRSLSAVRSR